MYDLIKLYKQESADVFNNIPTIFIGQFVENILYAYEQNKTIFVCGNGGNAAYVANLVTDLNLHPFVSEDKSKPMHYAKRLLAVNLCDSVSTITGITNDVGAEFIFSEQLKYQARAGDVLIGISGSGGSKNIVEALKQARNTGMATVLVTKKAQSKCGELAHFAIEITGDSKFPGQTGGNNNNFHFEDCISKLSHIATGILKQKVQG